MAFIIPTITEISAYQFQITLDGKIYIFVFRWNSVSEYWTFDILDFASTPIVVGIKLVINFPLIKRYASDLLPPGELIAVDPSGSLDRIGRYDLGDNLAKLIYVTEQEYKDDIENASV